MLWFDALRPVPLQLGHCFWIVTGTDFVFPMMVSERSSSKSSCMSQRSKSVDLEFVRFTFENYLVFLILKKFSDSFCSSEMLVFFIIKLKIERMTESRFSTGFWPAAM